VIALALTTAGLVLLVAVLVAVFATPAPAREETHRADR